MELNPKPEPGVPNRDISWRELLVRNLNREPTNEEIADFQQFAFANDLEETDFQWRIVIGNYLYFVKNKDLRDECLQIEKRLTEQSKFTWEHMFSLLLTAILLFVSAFALGSFFHRKQFSIAEATQKEVQTQIIPIRTLFMHTPEDAAFIFENLNEKQQNILFKALEDIGNVSDDNR